MKENGDDKALSAIQKKFFEDLCARMMQDGWYTADMINEELGRDVCVADPKKPAPTKISLVATRSD